MFLRRNRRQHGELYDERCGGPRQRVVATPGLGAADVTKNHPKCSKENRLNSPSKPLKLIPIIVDHGNGTLAECNDH
jgi:hypothetical protein